jgi:HEAT repeat protein
MISMSPGDTFKQIIELTEKTTALMEAFGELDLKEREAILTESFQKEADAVNAKDEISIRLIRTAEMLIGASTPKVAALLGKALDHENLDVRMLAGDVLMHMAEDGLDAIMPAVAAVLEKSGIGAEEMPFILAELDEPEVPRLLERFLESQNPDVVAAALEAMVECGDEDSIPAVEKLVDDPREVQVEESPNNDDKTTVGQLARDALDLLSEED